MGRSLDALLWHQCFLREAGEGEIADTSDVPAWAKEKLQDSCVLPNGLPGQYLLTEQNLRTFGVEPNEERIRFSYPALKLGGLGRFTGFYRDRLLSEDPKYLAPPRSRPRLYVPQMRLPDGMKTNLREGCTRSVRRLVNTPDYPMILVEGELKALAAMNTVGLSMLVVGVGGAWSWSYRGVLLKDFDRVALKDREVYIVFDSDAAEKEQVAEARARLAVVLQRRGANVKIVDLPMAIGGAKVGFDDWVQMAGGTLLAKLELLLGGARDPDPQDEKYALLSEPWVTRVIRKIDPKARPRATDWRARCPSCGGNGNVSIFPARDTERLMVHCFAGCDWKEVLKAARVTPKEMLPPRRREVAEAQTWLLKELKIPKRAEDLVKQASRNGISEKTLRRAKDHIGAEAFRKDNKWFWGLIRMSELNKRTHTDKGVEAGGTYSLI